MAFYYTTNSNYLAHHGVKGQKWGVRRYQNKDGSLTNAGNKAYRTANNLKNTWTKEAKDIYGEHTSERRAKIDRNYEKHKNEKTAAAVSVGKTLGKKYVKSKVRNFIVNAGNTSLDYYIESNEGTRRIGAQAAKFALNTLDLASRTQDIYDVGSDLHYVYKKSKH